MLKKLLKLQIITSLIFFGLIAFILGIIFSPITVLAVTTIDPGQGSGTKAPAYINPLTGLKEAAQRGGVIKDTGTPPTLQETVGGIIGAVLAFVGVIFLILIIYGGITWMTAGGNEEKIKKAKGLIVNSIIGLVIILAAYSIVSFIFSQIPK